MLQPQYMAVGNFANMHSGFKTSKLMTVPAFLSHWQPAFLCVILSAHCDKKGCFHHGSFSNITHLRQRLWICLLLSMKHCSSFMVKFKVASCLIQVLSIMVL